MVFGVKAVIAAVVAAVQELRVQWTDFATALAEIAQLRQTNAQLRAEMAWFKHRLNQVERERGQLIQAALGVKLAVPEFVPTYEDPGAALNDMPSLGTVGGDADENDVAAEAPDVDYSMMPGYGKAR